MTRKTAFFEGWSWFKFNNLGLALGTNLKFYSSLRFTLIPTFVEVTGKKLAGGGALGNSTFGFNFISHGDVVKEPNKLKSKKASQKTDIPIKVIKENVAIISHFLYHNFNNSLSCSTFPTGMKYADVTPTHKKDDKTDKTNYRPISILPNLSKVYERLMYKQISPYFDSH